MPFVAGGEFVKSKETETSSGASLRLDGLLLRFDMILSRHAKAVVRACAWPAPPSGRATGLEGEAASLHRRCSLTGVGEYFRVGAESRMSLASL